MVTEHFSLSSHGKFILLASQKLLVTHSPYYFKEYVFFFFSLIQGFDVT